MTWYRPSRAPVAIAVRLRISYQRLLDELMDGISALTPRGWFDREQFWYSFLLLYCPSLPCMMQSPQHVPLSL